MPRLTQVDGVEPLLVSPRDAMRMLGCSHQTLYNLMAAGELESFLVGRSRKVVIASVHRLIARRLEASRKFEAAAWHPALHRQRRRAKKTPTALVAK